jgi:hypothetical protein
MSPLHFARSFKAAASRSPNQYKGSSWAGEPEAAKLVMQVPPD